MNPLTHFLIGWAVTLPTDLSRRDRALVVAAAVVPDLDGLGVLVDVVKGRSAESLETWSTFHHAAAHNLAFALAVTLICLVASKRHSLTATMAFIAIHLHLLCDVIGSRGPDGHQWPVPYMAPFDGSFQLVVPWQWALDAWPNILITLILLGLTIYWAWAKGLSPVSLVSPKADQSFVSTLRKRFGHP
jgi:hypothetical protein